MGRKNIGIIMKISMSELREMIREAIKENLSKNETLKEFYGMPSGARGGASSRRTGSGVPTNKGARQIWDPDQKKFVDDKKDADWMTANKDKTIKEPVDEGMFGLPAGRSAGPGGRRTGSGGPMTSGWKPGQLDSMSLDNLASVMKKARDKGDEKEIGEIEAAMSKHLGEGYEFKRKPLKK